MKSVLLSIQPVWCEKIASGEKTVEVRKNKPKLDTPFKAYIYCTKPKTSRDVGLCLDGKKVGFIYPANYGYAMKHDIPVLSGKVIGEFVCDRIKWIGQTNLVVKEDAEEALAGTCLTRKDIFEYLGLPREKGDDRYRECYGWHISDLVIYDEPKELGEFTHEKTSGVWSTKERIKRPPQSWCYVDEI